MSHQELTQDQHEKMQSVLYYMGKSAARDSFSEFLDFCGCTVDDWELIKKHIQDQLSVELYI